MVAYRPNDKTANAEKYAPCPSCYGYYEVKQLWKHYKKRCPLATEAPKSQTVVSQASYLLPVPAHVSANTHKIMSVMLKDSVYREAVNDEVIEVCRQADIEALC